MLTSLAYLAVMHSQIPTRITEYQIPILGGEREMVLGPAPHQTEFQGYYFQEASGASQGNGLPPHAINYEEVRAGWMSWSVAPYQHDGKPAFLLQTEGQYKQVLDLGKRNKLPLDNKAKISYWISPEGKLLQENVIITVAAGVWVMAATFHEDSYDLYLKNPDHPASTTTVYPGGGMERFNSTFAPMIKDGKVLMEKKVFDTLDPRTGAPVEHTATVAGHFNAKWFNDTPYKGRYIDIEAGKGKMRVFLSDEGYMMRVQFPNDHYLNIEEKPGEHFPIGH
jgi:hypothetical protein